MSKKREEISNTFTSEQLEEINEYVASASNEELVELIYDALNLYPDFERKQIEKKLEDFLLLTKSRLQLTERYKCLIKCLENWKKYETACTLYSDACKIRKIYNDIKQKQQKAGNNYSTYKLLEDISKKLITNPIMRDDETKRRCLIPEENLGAIKRPDTPEVYYSSIDQIPVMDMTLKEVFSKIEYDNLVSFLSVLLQYLGLEGKDNKAYAKICLFLGKYTAFSNHKKNPGSWSSTLMTHEELMSDCNKLLKEIEEVKKKCEIIENSYSK